MPAASRTDWLIELWIDRLVAPLRQQLLVQPRLPPALLLLLPPLLPFLPLQPLPQLLPRLLSVLLQLFRRLLSLAWPQASMIRSDNNREQAAIRGEEKEKKPAIERVAWAGASGQQQE